MSEHALPQALNYRTARYQISAAKFNQCPDDTGAEVAFAGRSNAGKSSAINKLTGQTKLARTSKTPGRTQLINFFSIGNTTEHRLVDLPGYGYAKVPVEVKLAWQRELEAYLRQRRSLRGMILLTDIRHPLQEFDLQMLQWAVQAEMPVHVLLTKADKLKFGKAKEALLQVEKALRQFDGWHSVQLFSALNGQGVEQLCEHLDHWLLADPDAGAEDGE